MRALAPLALIALAALTAASPIRAETTAQTGEGNTVLELFTSQGCSSCPPADALLGEFAEKPGIVALSYSVDYWNYLGWRDTLSSAANSDRQREYARARGDGRVYTPQLVIDGLLHVNGSDGAAIDQAMKDASSRLAGIRVPVSMHGEGDTLVIDVGAAPVDSHTRAATVWLAIAKDKETVSITRGENRGRTLTYHHPVRELSPVGMWKGDAMTLRLPLKDLKTMGGDCLMTLVQVENSGPILGAAEFEVGPNGS
ncbi:DUF1223 domain-containing protein [Methyloceanibacter sp.]|uniref:DUF1223 domain-containing protein n=1 Tax=Methyloceanibacter sp. TaxID=1965321 RepID=UPI002D410CF3|nr:DUF1223 domain-containing protein [Methyloceanibacter sp.]HZP09657.1 DUF1223 domain-containing protein [Methyloceanibacter sp.]